MRKSSFSGYVYDFSVGYDAITVDDIKDIHKYLMKKNHILQYIRMCLKDTSCKATYKKCIY